MVYLFEEAGGRAFVSVVVSSGRCALARVFAVDVSVESWGSASMVSGEHPALSMSGLGIEVMNGAGVGARELGVVVDEDEVTWVPSSFFTGPGFGFLHGVSSVLNETEGIRLTSCIGVRRIPVDSSFGAG